MAGDWDGRERRKMSQNEVERDRLLTETHTNVKNLLESFDRHLIDDKENFKSLHNGQEFLKRFVYGALGIIAFISFMAQFMRFK